MRPSSRWTILEAGAGKGQLTIPLLRRLPGSTSYIAVDSSRGAYRDWLPQLTRLLDATRLRERVRVLNEDVRRMLSVKSQSVNAIVSNELLCDLPREAQLARAFREFRNTLVLAAILIHGEWSSVPRKDQKSFQVTHNPSWNPDQLSIQASNAGFVGIEFCFFDTTLKFKGESAEREVESWAPAKHFLPKNKHILRKHGMRLPPEHIIFCHKPR